MKKYLLIILSLFTFVFTAEKYITTDEAINHIGENQVVCGEVASTKYAYNSRGMPTFINLDEAYPNHTFTIVIWRDGRRNFDVEPEEYYQDKEVCVEGLIKTFKNKPQIIVREQSQITVVPEKEEKEEKKSSK